jgi:hypothetical protein
MVDASYIMVQYFSSCVWVVATRSDHVVSEQWGRWELLRVAEENSRPSGSDTMMEDPPSASPTTPLICTTWALPYERL